MIGERATNQVPATCIGVFLGRNDLRLNFWKNYNGSSGLWLGRPVKGYLVGRAGLEALEFKIYTGENIWRCSNI